MSSNSQSQLIESLAESQIYRDYEKAFGDATGLPLNLSPVENWHLAHHGRKHENPFCAQMVQCNKACAACLRAQQQTSDAAASEPRTVLCFAGLCETSVPLRVGNNLIGFLKTGEVMLSRPTESRFARTARQLAEWGLRMTFQKSARPTFTRAPFRERNMLQLFGCLVSLPSIFLSSPIKC